MLLASFSSSSRSPWKVVAPAVDHRTAAGQAVQRSESIETGRAGSIVFLGHKPVAAADYLIDLDFINGARKIRIRIVASSDQASVCSVCHCLKYACRTAG